MIEGELRRNSRPRWWQGIPQVSNYVRAFWTRLQVESTETVVVLPDDSIRLLLEPTVELGQSVISIGPSRQWSDKQRDCVEMLVEEGPTRCVWLGVNGTSELVCDIIAAYESVTPLRDICAELPYDFDRLVLESALKARFSDFVFAPGAEEPIILVAARPLQVR